MPVEGAIERGQLIGTQLLASCTRLWEIVSPTALTVVLKFVRLQV